jgi:hypothetical protein
MISIAAPADLDGVTDDANLKRLHRYWTERRGVRPFPSRAEIDPVEFGFALGRVSLIDVARRPQRFRYRLVSTQMTKHLGYEMTGRFLDELPETDVRAYAERFYAETVLRALPLYQREETVLDGRRWSHQALSLPLSSDGSAIDMLMVYRVAGAPVRVAAGG